MRLYTNNRENINRYCYSDKRKSILNETWRTSARLQKITEHINVAKWGFVMAGSIRIDTVIKPVSFIEEQFNELAEKWKNETGAFSTTFHKVNDSYLDIIGMGKEVVPFILKDLQKPLGTAHWHYALKALTKENPVQEKDSHKNSKIKEAWISWGTGKKLI